MGVIFITESKTMSTMNRCVMFSTVMCLLFSLSFDRPHPYIFFNQDKSSATFIGFAFSDSGDLTDPRNGEVIEENFASPDLVSLLKQLGIQEQKE